MKTVDVDDDEEGFACDDCRFLRWKVLSDPRCGLDRRLPTYGDLQYRGARLPKHCARGWLARHLFRLE